MSPETAVVLSGSAAEANVVRPAGPAQAADPPPQVPPTDPAVASLDGPATSRGRRIAFQAAVSASLLAVLVLGFAVYLLGLSSLQEQHSQANLYRTIAAELASITAPVGPAPDGTPIAVLDIPSIGLRQAVVVEGTTGVDLARGPGHLRNSAFPGQNGVATVFGRRTAFGAPFAHLPALRVGDKINVTTGEGTFSYTVNAYGTAAHPIVDPARARLVLVTGDTSLVARNAVYVGARLDGTPTPVSAAPRPTAPIDQPLATDPDALQAVQLWSLAFLLATVGAVLLARLWHRQAAYLAATPVLAALAWCVYENLAFFLPNLT